MPLPPRPIRLRPPSPTGPVLKWPGGARVAFWIAPNVEHYEYLPAAPATSATPGRECPHPRRHVLRPARLREQGRDLAHDRGDRQARHALHRLPQRGRPRALNPEIRDAMVERDWDYMTHGIYNTQYITTYTEEQEREFYRDCRDTLLKHTGKPLKGDARSIAIHPPTAPPDLMAEGRPHLSHRLVPTTTSRSPLKVKSGKLISMPYSHRTQRRALLQCPVGLGSRRVRRHVQAAVRPPHTPKASPTAG